MGNGDREMVSFLDGEPTREQNEGPFDASLPYMSTTE
jgi:hypothetical protein